MGSPWAYDVVSTSILGWNNIATSTTRYQRCFKVVLKTLHQRYRIDVVSTWNQGLFFDVNWQPKFNVVSTLFLGSWINVVELTLFQRGIRVDFSLTSFNDVVTTSCNRRLNDLHFQRFYNVVSTDVVSTLYRRLFAHWVVFSWLPDLTEVLPPVMSLVGQSTLCCFIFLKHCKNFVGIQNMLTHFWSHCLDI